MLGFDVRGWRIARGEQAIVSMMVGVVLCCSYNPSVISLHSRVTPKSAQAVVVPPHACLAVGSAFLALHLGLRAHMASGCAASLVGLLQRDHCSAWVLLYLSSPLFCRTNTVCPMDQ